MLSGMYGSGHKIAFTFWPRMGNGVVNPSGLGGVQTGEISPLHEEPINNPPD